MTTYIETKEEFTAANENDALDWEVAGEFDLADLEYGNDTYDDTLLAIRFAFQKANDIELGLWARFAWEEIAHDFYNSNR
ncbi:hypothetical protein [Glutamicibacter ardleyensis]|uniref:hypothetical protein n=1 Tax=Glutamicibacter ardleyensis TaxID=225894 RepID=UPI003FD32318